MHWSYVSFARNHQYDALLILRCPSLHQDLQRSLDEGQKRLSTLQECSLKLQQVAPPEEKSKVKDETDTVRQRYDDLKSALSETSSSLQSQLSLWDDYEEKRALLDHWLEGMEEKLAPQPEPKLEIVEKKAQLDKYKVRIRGGVLV